MESSSEDLDAIFHYDGISVDDGDIEVPSSDTQLSDWFDLKIYVEIFLAIHESDKFTRFLFDQLSEAELNDLKLMAERTCRDRRNSVGANEYRVLARRMIPKDIERMMGAANLCYVKGDKLVAAKTYESVLKSYPYFSEPFAALGNLFLEQKEINKAIKFFIYASLLKAKDSDTVQKTVKLLEENDATKLAIQILKYAFARTKLAEYAILLGGFYEKTNCLQLTIFWYSKSLKSMLEVNTTETPSVDVVLPLLRKTVSLSHFIGKDMNAAELFELAFKVFPNLSLEEVNLYLEILLVIKDYHRALAFLRDYTKVEIVFETNGDKVTVLNLNYPPDLLVDIRAKVVAVLVGSGNVGFAIGLLESLKQYSVKDIGDIYVELTNVLMAQKEFSLALMILELLVTDEQYHDKNVLQKYASCLRELGKIEDSLVALDALLTLAPDDDVSRITMMSLVVETAGVEHALRFAQLNDFFFASSCPFSHLKVALYCAELLKDDPKRLWCLTVHMLMLLARRRIYVVGDCNIVTAVTNSLGPKWMDRIHRHAPLVWPETIDSDFVSELWTFFLSYAASLAEEKSWHRLEILVSLAVMATVWPTPNFEKLIPLLFQTCVLSGNAQLGYDVLQVLSYEMSRVIFYNVCHLMYTGCREKKIVRSLIRRFKVNTSSPVDVLIHAHSLCTKHSFKHAIFEYQMVLDEFHDDPIIYLSIAVCYLNLIASTRELDIEQFVGHALIFLNHYQALRGECQETHYNLARAYQWLGINHLAIHHYKSVLALPSVVQVSPYQPSSDCNLFNLQLEAAFNLSVIYRHSGNNILAKKVVEQYLVI